MGFVNVAGCEARWPYDYFYKRVVSVNDSSNNTLSQIHDIDTYIM